MENTIQAGDNNTEIIIIKKKKNVHTKHIFTIGKKSHTHRLDILYSFGACLFGCSNRREGLPYIIRRIFRCPKA